MGIREKINEKPAVATSVTAAVLVISLIFMAFQLNLFGGGVSPQEVWYWEGGDEYSVAPSTKLYEEAGPDGPIQAHRFHFGDGEPFTLYLSRARPAGPDDLGYATVEVRSASDPTWYPQDSDEGYRITMRPSGPDGQPAVPYLP